jgi:hypothetical protein
MGACLQARVFNQRFLRDRLFMQYTKRFIYSVNHLRNEPIGTELLLKTQ